MAPSCFRRPAGAREQTLARSPDASSAVVGKRWRACMLRNAEPVPTALGRSIAWERGRRFHARRCPAPAACLAVCQHARGHSPDAASAAHLGISR